MRLCVLIPAKDEALGIAKTVKSVIRAGILPGDIHVVDDGSSDNTGVIALGLGANVLRNEINISKAKSIERGTAHWHLTEAYDIISLLDADTEVSENYYHAVREGFNPKPGAFETTLKQYFFGRILLFLLGIRFQTKKIVAVCGQARSEKHNWLTAYRALSYAISHFLYKEGQDRLNTVTVAPGCAASYTSEAFKHLEWTRDTIVEDMDVTVQLHRKNLGCIVYQKKAIVRTQDPDTIRDYCKQTFRWHTGAWQVGLKYGMITGRLRVDWEYKFLMIEGMIFAALLLVSPLWLLFGLTPKALGWSILIDSSILAGLALLTAIAQRRIDILLYSPLYPLLRFLDASVFIYSFWRTVLKRDQIHGWYAVKRY